LDKIDSEKLALQIAGKKLPDEIIQVIIEKTQGIPLFIEEVMQGIMDSGVLEPEEDHYTLKGPLPESLIPATLQDLLFAKLDQLGKAKETAQLAAVFGRDFTADMLQVISGLDFETLTEHLNILVNESVLVVKGKLPNIQFSFKQALMQEKAYQLLLISKRQQYHLMIAEALDRNYPAYSKANPDLVAQHYTLGEKFIPAIDYWYKAGVSSLSRSAFEEAIAFFNRGRALIPQIQSVRQKNALELLLLSGLAPALLTTKGYTDESVGPAFERAYQLVNHVKNLPHLSSILSGLWAHYTALGKHQTALTVAKRLNAIAGRTRNTFDDFEAGKAMGANFFWRGEFTQAQKYLDKALKNFTPDLEYKQVYLYAEHAVVSTLAYHAINSWVLGDAEKAMQSSSASITYAKKLNHPFTLIYAHGFATVLHWLRDDMAETRRYAKETMQLGERYGFSSWIQIGSLFYQWTLAVKNPQKGLEGMEKIIENIRSSGSALWMPTLLGMQAGLYGKVRQQKRAHALIDKALRLAINHNERFFMAELLRIQGTLFQLSRKKKDAEKAFTKALKISVKQEAKYFELRTAGSLLSLKGRNEDREKLRQLISALIGGIKDNKKSKELSNARMLIKA